VQVTALDGTGYDVVVKSAGSWAGKTGYLPDGALVEAQGIIGNQVFNEGRLGGELDGTDTKINCLGHASGQKRAAYITNGTTEDMLKGLGFTCIVGDSTVLAPYIKKGKYAMMVYMYMYKPSWRSHDDQGLPFSGLAAKYGWTTDSWKQPNVYFGPNGEDRPIDYHALDYNAKTKKWEWVAQNREREGVGRCSWRRRAAAAVPPGTRSPRPSDPRAYCRAQVTGRAPVTGRVVISRSRFEGATGLSRPR
jgi:hypothetical protein